ncbi:multicopper oxidase family protein [Microbacterium sp. 22242]|uniref:multicopper oxidase family protein n=1 Tax=Microbacterium sp. 22242 TaxID=3453896 RepID=UPI003F853C15
MIELTRRRLLGLAAGLGAAAGVGVPLFTGVAGSSSTGVLLASERARPRPFTSPFAVPPVLAPTRQDDETDYYELVQRPGRARILPDVDTPIWGYNGIFPGPTIHARQGRSVVVRHRNELGVPVVVHLHGAQTPPESDGYPTDLIIPPGWRMPAPSPAMPEDARARVVTGERLYSYPMDQRAATLWYHDHRMGFTGASVWRGLAGFLLIHDDEEETLPLPRGSRDLPIMIADRSFAADGSLRYPSLDPALIDMPGVEDAYTAGVLGDVILVNGRAWPRADIDAARYRLRLLNASNARRYRLALDPPPPGGGGLVQIGSDGGLLHRPIAHDAIEIAPAERFDVVVDFSRYRPGQRVILRDEFEIGPTSAVMRFDVGDPAPDDSRIPETLSPIRSLSAADASVQRSFLFRNLGGQMGWQINGRPFDPGHADATVALGSTEVWRLVTDFHHPIHLHLAQFQVLSRGLSGPGPYDHGWKDVIDLRPAEEATIAARFTGYRGRYVFHCHNLEHEDMAMMGNLLVT